MFYPPRPLPRGSGPRRHASRWVVALFALSWLAWGACRAVPEAAHAPGSAAPPQRGAGEGLGVEGALSSPQGSAAALSWPQTLAVVSSVTQTRIYALHEQPSSLQPLGVAEGAEYWAASPDGKHLYGVVTAPSGVQVMALSLGRHGKTRKISEVAIPSVVGATHLALHPSGQWLFVAHTLSGQASVLPVQADGGIGDVVQTIDNGPKSHYVMADQSGKHVFVPSLEGHYVGQFLFDASSGLLTPNDPPRSPEVVNARHMDIHPSERFAYVLGAASSTLASFSYDAASGLLSNPHALSTVPEGAPSTAGAAHVVVHPTGRFVYASNRNHHSIAIFSVDDTTGHAALSGYEQAEGRVQRPRDFGIDSSGRFLLSANKDGEGRALLFDIDSADGGLALASSAEAPAKATYAGFVSRELELGGALREGRRGGIVPSELRREFTASARPQ